MYNPAEAIERPGPSGDPFAQVPVQQALSHRACVLIWLAAALAGWTVLLGLLQPILI